MSGVNRHSFFKLLIAGTAGLALAPSLSTHQEFCIPIRWVGREHVAEKYALVQKLMGNAIETHDRMIEETIFGVGV